MCTVLLCVRIVVTLCVTNAGGPEVVHDLSNYMENWCYKLKDPPHLAHRTDKWVLQIVIVGGATKYILVYGYMHNCCKRKFVKKFFPTYSMYN